MCKVLVSMYCWHKGGWHLPFCQAAVSFMRTFTHLEQSATHRKTCNACRKFISVSFHSLCWSITDASTPCARIPVSSHGITEDLLSAPVTLFATSSVKSMGERTVSAYCCSSEETFATMPRRWRKGRWSWTQRKVWFVQHHWLRSRKSDRYSACTGMYAYMYTHRHIIHERNVQNYDALMSFDYGVICIISAE